MSDTPIMVRVQVHETKEQARAAYDTAFAAISTIVREAGLMGAVIVGSALHVENGQTHVLVSMDGCGAPDCVEQIMEKVIRPELRG